MVIKCLGLISNVRKLTKRSIPNISGRISLLNGKAGKIKAKAIAISTANLLSIACITYLIEKTSVL
jgi:hypothetical protein